MIPCPRCRHAMKILAMDTQAVSVDCPVCGEYTIPLADVGPTINTSRSIFQQISYIEHDPALTPPRMSLWQTVKCSDLFPEFSGCEDIFKVYWIDGFYQRNNITVEFDDGGNPGAYPTISKVWDGRCWECTFIPKGEIWIEVSGDLTDTRDEGCVLRHEVYECHLMTHLGQGYEEAHGAAQRMERKYRTQWKDPDRLWTRDLTPIDVGPGEEE